MGRHLLVVAATVLLFALAGCVDGNLANVAEDGMDHEMALPMSGLDLQLQGCREGGGVSLYNMQEGETGPVVPFRKTSISDDTGNPSVASYGQPIPPGGATWGIWHISFVCEEHIVNGVAKGPLSGGWVGVRILPPAWDASGIQRQYFVADLSFSDWDLVEAFNAEGVHASRLLDSRIDWVAPDVVHTIFDDEEHGLFETHARMKDYKAMETGPMRFWMLITMDGSHVHDVSGKGTFRPISFDLTNSGDGARHMVVDGTGWLSHTRTDEHGEVPGAAGNVGGLLWTGFDRSLVAGPGPHDVVLNQTWVH